MSIKEYTHAPLSKLDYGFDWTGWLKESETITQSTWTATTGITLTSDLINAGTTSVFAEGGVAGKVYTLTNTIVTSAGRKDSRSLTLSCKIR